MQISRTQPRAIIMLIAVTAIFLVMPVMAHAPDVIIDVSKATSQISVLVAHNVENPTTHYINHIKVVQNGRTVVDNYYKSQPSIDTFSYSYPVPVNAGDTLRVTVTCNSGEYNEAVLTLPTPTTTARPTIPQTTMPLPPTTQKSPLGQVALAGLVICSAMFLVLNRR